MNSVSKTDEVRGKVHSAELPLKSFGIIVARAVVNFHNSTLYLIEGGGPISLYSIGENGIEKVREGEVLLTYNLSGKPTKKEIREHLFDSGLNIPERYIGKVSEWVPKLYDNF